MDKSERQGPARYGNYYWCVKTKLSQNGEIYLNCDFVKINVHGDVSFMQENGVCNLAISASNWTAVYAANVMDGSPVAVEHWKGEVIEPY